MNIRKLVYIFTLLIANIGFAQVYETGISYNVGSIVGERNGAFPIGISNKNFGVIVKKNMNPRFSYRAALNVIESNNTQLAELSGGVDFNFTNYNLVRTGSTEKSNAYLIFEAATLLYKSGRNTKFAVALPMGIGFKQAITKKIIWSLEAKARIAFTDTLDNPVSMNNTTLDAYYYIGTSIYYTFGWPRGSKNQIRF